MSVSFVPGTGLSAKVGKTLGEIRMKKNLKKQNEEYSNKIPDFQGSLIISIITHPKLITTYYIVLTTIIFSLLIYVFSVDKKTGNFVALIALIILFIGLILGIILMALCSKKLLAIYTKQYLLLKHPKSGYEEQVYFSKIDKLCYKKKTLVFVDKNGKSINVKISGIIGLPEFIYFLRKNYIKILKLMSDTDKEKYNKFIDRMISYSTLYSDECLL